MMERMDGEKPHMVIGIDLGMTCKLANQRRGKGRAGALGLMGLARLFLSGWITWLSIHLHSS